MFRNAFGNTLLIAVNLGGGSKDNHFEVEEEPPEGGGVREALMVKLLGVVLGGGGENGSNDVAGEFSEFYSASILEEVPPGGKELWGVMEVDGGDKGEALRPLVWLVGGMGVGC